MKLNLFILSVLLSNFGYAQSAKDSLLQKDINILVEEMEFMYGYDQTMREYLVFKTFDKSETNRIENLPDSLRIQEMKTRTFVSDSIGTFIYRKYINPMDAAHTERMMAITKKYGFPSAERIKKYYHKAFDDPEFNPLIIFIHAPKKYWEELKELMLNEYQHGVINRCEYGYALWQFTGRKSFQPLLDNGFTLLNENGATRLKSTCE